MKGGVDQEHLMKTSIVQEIEYRLDVLRSINGAHIDGVSNEAKKKKKLEYIRLIL